MQEQMNGLVKIVKLILFAFLVALFLLAEQQGLFGAKDDCCGMFGKVLRSVGLGKHHKHKHAGEHNNVATIETSTDAISQDTLDLAEVTSELAVEAQGDHSDCSEECPHARRQRELEAAFASNNNLQ
jgi:hypothetical protein